MLLAHCAVMIWSISAHHCVVTMAGINPARCWYLIALYSLTNRQVLCVVGISHFEFRAMGRHVWGVFLVFLMASCTDHCANDALPTGLALGGWSDIVVVPPRGCPCMISPCLLLLFPHSCCNRGHLDRPVPIGIKAMVLSMFRLNPMSSDSSVTIVIILSMSSACAPQVMSSRYDSMTRMRLSASSPFCHIFWNAFRNASANKAALKGVSLWYLCHCFDHFDHPFICCEDTHGRPCHPMGCSGH